MPNISYQNQTVNSDSLNSYYENMPGSTRLDSKTAATYLNLRPNTLEAWRSQGRYQLPYTRIGRKIYYKLCDLRKFMEDRTATHTGEYK